jgi:glycosyltransferase involved in cell wall biosynthesis
MKFASNPMPRFTFGIPVYNGEHTLKETLDCCANLPADQVRVLVSDNGSTDGTYAMAQAFAERCPHISVYRHEQNVGAANNFKYLLDSCCTEYFMWLAADDVIADSLSLAEVELLFQHYPRAMAVSPFAMVGEVGAQVPDRGNRSLVGSCGENTLRFLLRPGVNSRFYSVYRTERLRALFASTFGVNNGGYFASDIAFSVAVLRQGEWPLAQSFVLSRKPGISSDGWKLRKVYAKGLLDAVFPSVKFIRQIVGMSTPLEKLPVLLVSSLLYVRYFIGPLKHRLAKYSWRS